jgi:hypothetical protein
VYKAEEFNHATKEMNLKTQTLERERESQPAFKAKAEGEVENSRS